MMEYKAKFTSDEATFYADVVDFNIQDSSYTNIGEKDILKLSSHKPPFWVTFEFVDEKDALLEYLIKASKNPDTFRPQKVEIPVEVKDSKGTIVISGGIIPKPIKQPSVFIELKFENIEYLQA
jgi:hypothetical protein